jgi:hypothetical protein
MVKEATGQPKKEKTNVKRGICMYASSSGMTLSTHRVIINPPYLAHTKMSNGYYSPLGIPSTSSLNPRQLSA